ncbi:MAG: ABC transporter ATP-binding protein [Chloroflexi bacterium]|nr:ABC transporter ATP-binding protein [Chloroflexota bacterium]
MDIKPMLKVDNLTKKFGNLIAVNHASFEVHSGEIVGLIGPNGAGKTTLFNAISGLYKPEEGTITFKGKNITGWLPHKICKLGMSRTFQVTRAFTHMTVEDTVRVGAYNRFNEKNVQEKVDQVIQLCDLMDIRKRICLDLGLASLRKVELARALATEPEMLLLDEAGAGLNAIELEVFMDLIKKLNQEHHITFCVVEHVMQMVMGLCQQIVVLDSGEIIASGTPSQISTNARVIEAYLGKRAVHVRD